MSKQMYIEPKTDFIKDIIDLGGQDLKKCYQCATCSVRCAISPDENPFPRKEMIWAQWGLEDRLIADPDVWLCHQCNDCTSYCPRKAKPGDVLAAIRRYTIKHYSKPKALVEFINDRANLRWLFIIPAIIIFLFVVAFGSLFPAGDVEYSHFFPHAPLIFLYTLAFGLAVVSAVNGGYRYFNDMMITNNAKPKRSLKDAIWLTLKEIFTHDKFKDCTTSNYRYLAHLGMFYGFIGLLITTGWAVIMLYVFHYYPLKFYDPFKLLGNLAGLIFILGLFMAIKYRLEEDEDRGVNTYFDWVFLYVLIGVIATGFIVEFSRWINVRIFAYPSYFVHLVLVFFLLIYFPYTKFAHIIYRTVAILYSKYTDRAKEIR